MVEKSISDIASIQSLELLLDGSSQGGKPQTRRKSTRPLDLETYDIEHFDYGYVERCSDLDELYLILAVLESKKEGFYPDLERAVKARIQLVSGGPVDVEETTLAPSRVTYEQHKEVSAELEIWIDDKRSEERENSSGKGQRENSVPIIALADKFVTEYEDNLVPRLRARVELSDTLSVSEADEMAELEKLKGNEALKAQDVREALVYYTRSLQLSVKCKTLCNRALAYYKLKEYTKAENDAEMAITMIQADPALDPEKRVYVKGLLRLGKARSAIGKYVEAIGNFDEALSIVPGDGELIAVRDETERRYRGAYGPHAQTETHRTLTKAASEETVVSDVNVEELSASSSAKKIRMNIVEVDGSDGDDDSSDAEDKAAKEPGAAASDSGSVADFIRKEYSKTKDSSALNF